MENRGYIGQTWNGIGTDGIASNDITSVSITHIDLVNKMFVVLSQPHSIDPMIEENLGKGH